MLMLIFTNRALAKDYIEIWPEGWSEVQPLFSTSIYADRFSVEHDDLGTSTFSVDGLYFRELDLTYRLIKDSTIQEEIVLVEKRELDNPVLNLDDAGNRHLVWLERSLAGNSLSYAKITVPYSGHEQVVFLETKNTIQDLAAVQEGDVTHLVWSERDPYFQINYGRLENGKLVEVTTITDSTDLSVRPNIVLDEEGTPHIIWYETTSVSVQVFYSRLEEDGFSAPLRVGVGSIQDIQEGGTLALTARNDRIYAAWAAVPRNANRLFIHLTEIAAGRSSQPVILALGSKPRFVPDTDEFQMVWQGVGEFGAEIHHGILRDGQITEKTNLTIGRKMGFRPEVVSQNGFLYIYWLQADPNRGFKLHEINNQFPKKITLWRKIGLDETAPLVHSLFLAVSTIMLSFVYTAMNLGVLVVGGLLFALIQRWEAYKKQPLFYQVLLAAVLLLVISQLPIAAGKPRFFGVIHYALSFVLATLGTYFLMRPVKDRGFFVYAAIFVLWMVLFGYFSLLPQNILT